MIVKLTSDQYNMLLNERPLTSVLSPIENGGLMKESLDPGNGGGGGNTEAMKKKMLVDVKKFLDTVGSLTGYLGHMAISAEVMEDHYNILKGYKSIGKYRNEDGTTGTHLCDLMELYLKEKKKTKTFGPSGGTTKWSAANRDNNLVDDIEEVMTWPGSDLQTYKNKSMDLLKNTNCTNTELIKTTTPLPDQIWDCCRHEIIDTAALIIAFVPGGIWVAAGIEVAHAALYLHEGEKMLAGIALLFSALPFIGEIPFVKQLTAGTIRGIIKTAQAGGKFTKAQFEVIKRISGFKSEFKAAMGQIKTLKPKFVKEVGQEAYDKLMKDVLSKKITKADFVNALKNPTKYKESIKSGVKQIRAALSISATQQKAIKNLLDQHGWNKSWVDEAGEMISYPIEVSVKKGDKMVKKQVHMTVSDVYPKSQMKWKGKMEEVQWPIEEGVKAVRYFDPTYGKDYIIVKRLEAGGTLDYIRSMFEHELIHTIQPSQLNKRLRKIYDLPTPKTMEEAMEGLTNFSEKEIKGALGEAFLQMHKNMRGLDRETYEKALKSLRDDFDWGTWLKMADETPGYLYDIPGIGPEAVRIVKEAFEILKYKTHPFEIEATFQPVITSLIRVSKENKEVPGQLLKFMKENFGLDKFNTMQIPKEYWDLYGKLPHQFWEMIQSMDSLRRVNPARAQKLYGDLYKQLKNLEQNVSRVVTPKEKSAVQKYISNLQKESIKNRTTIKLTETQYNKLIKEQKYDFGYSGIPASHQQSYLKYIEDRKPSTKKALDTLQFGMDWAGLIPGIGDVIDIVNAILYFGRGEAVQGTLSVIAVIPFVGSIVALPFKVLFRALGKVGEKLMLDGIGLLLKGKGDVFVDLFIETSRKHAPAELKKVLNMVKSKIGKIIEELDKMNAPFVKMSEFTHTTVPDLILKKINILGKKGKSTVKGFKNFFIGLSEEGTQKQTKKTLTQKRFEEPGKEPGVVKKITRAAKLSDTEKGVLKYIKGYSKIDKRLKPYVGSFREYYSKTIKGPWISTKDKLGSTQDWTDIDKFSNLTDDEITRFLTKHYDEDILPKLKGHYANHILAHGSPDIRTLEVIDVNLPYMRGGKVGKNTQNKGIIGQGFSLTSNKKTADWYGHHNPKYTQPMVLNDINKILYIRPNKVKGGLTLHDYDGYRVSMHFGDHTKAKEILSPEDWDLFNHYPAIYKKSHPDGGNPFSFNTDAIPELMPNWEQRSYNLGTEKIRDNLKKAGISKKGIDDLLDNDVLTIKQKRTTEPSISGENVMIEDLMKTGGYDAIVTNVNTLKLGHGATLRAGSDVGPAQFPNAEIIVKQKDAHKILSLFPSAKKIEGLVDGKNISRNMDKRIYPKDPYGKNIRDKEGNIVGPSIHDESHKRKTKIKLSESQYKKILLREFGETVTNPKEWYLRVLDWVDSPDELDFETDQYEVVAYDTNGAYLGYYDKDQGFGFVVTEYGIGLEDEEENVVHGVYPPDVDGDGDRDADDASRCDYADHCDYDGDGYIDEQEEAGTGAAATATITLWADLVSPVRGPDNTLDNSPWAVSPVRGPDNTLDNSPWSVSPVRGPANELT